MILYCLIGIITGTITGLIPGLHTNNIAAFLLVSPLFGQEFMAFLLSMSITHTFVDFIPSIFIGAPSADTFESILPAHKMFLEGKAFEAVCLTVFGGLIALIGSVIFVPIFFGFITQNTDAIIFFTPTILFIALIGIISSEKNIILTLLLMLSSAALGIIFSNQLFPLITGFFGLPTVLLSLNKPVQEISQDSEFNIENKNILEGIIGIVGGAIVSVIPGIGNNVAAAIIKLFRKNPGTKGYLVLLGSINTSNFFFSFTVLFAISKTRNGIMIALQEKMIFIQEFLILGLIIMFFSGMIAAIITIFISKKALSLFSGKKAFFGAIASIAIMITMVALLNGITGIVALTLSSAIGGLAVLKGTKRSACMAALIIPSAFFYLFYLI